MDQRASILYIDCHDLGTMLGCYGRYWVDTPNIDRLAANGVRFTNQFAACPICGPSRIAMYFGILPHRADVYGNTSYEPRCEVTPMARHFAVHGYRTGLIGGWKTNGTPSFAGYQASVVPPETPEGFAGALRRLIDGEAGRPWFAHASFQRAHRPFGQEYDPAVARALDVPAWLPDEPEIRADLATLAHHAHELDRCVGALLAELDRSGEAERTIVVFTTDHGPAIGRAKHTLYDAGLRTALLFRLPGAAAAVRTQLVSGLDVYPTLCDLAGISAPEGLDGISFAGAFDESGTAGRPHVVSEMTYGQRSGMQFYWPARCVRTATHKFMRVHTDLPPYLDTDWLARVAHRREIVERWPLFGGSMPGESLFDLENDPNETINLLAEGLDHGSLDALIEPLRAALDETMSGDELLTGDVASRKESPVVPLWVRPENRDGFVLHYDLLSETSERPFPPGHLGTTRRSLC